jgi:hypothetical protein
MKYIIIMLSIMFITDVGTCQGIDQSICTPGSDPTYHANGRLKTCTLKDNFAINGVTCKQYAAASQATISSMARSPAISTAKSDSTKLAN